MEPSNIARCMHRRKKQFRTVTRTFLWAAFSTVTITFLTVVSNAVAEERAEQKSEQSGAPVTVVEVQSAPLTSKIKLTGTISARRHSVLSAELDGLVNELLVDTGDLVAAGDPLLRLRPQPTQLQLAFEQAGKRRADADVKLGQLKEKRLTTLLKTQAAAQGNYDLAEAELHRAMADQAASRASVARVNDELQRHQVRAPFSGVISQKHTELGTWVTPGDPLLTLDELAILRISAPLPQAYFNQVDKGSEVALQFPALPGQTIAASVTRKVAVANPESRTLPLLIDIPNPDNQLTPGMSVAITVHLSNKLDKVLQVPVDALVRQANGSTLLWKVVAEGEQLRVAPAPVKTGHRQYGLIEIIEGPISAGDRVVEQGNERMRPGLPIRIVADH